MLKQMKLGVRLGLGFTALTIILATAVVTSLYFVKKSNVSTEQLVTLRVPTAQNSLRMLNGINHSLAALRGWIILGKDKFKKERQFAWDKEINESLENMKILSKKWTSPKNIESFDRIKIYLNEFDKHQKEIEDIAQTRQNVPSTFLLFKEAAPQAKVLAASITKIINIEATLEATVERKQILGMMADVRGTTGLGLAAIRAYLLSGDENFKLQFETLWKKNTRRYNDLLNSKHLLSSDQASAFAEFQTARKVFDSLPQKMFELRAGSDWNLANAWLGTKAAPIAFKIKKELDAMLKNQNSLLNKDMSSVRNLSRFLIRTQWIILILGITLSFLVGYFVTRAVTHPIRNAIESLRRGSTEVSSASNQLSSASQQLSSGASEQASSLEETSASLEELTGMVESNVTSAEKTLELSNNVKDCSLKGSESIEKLKGSMEDILDSNEKIKKLVQIIGNIGKKTEIMDEIVFQTKLLSFNASVEAERAGEHGRGFAVVAQEVGNLAQMSGKAATEIAEIVEGSLSDANLITEENKKRVDQGNIYVSEAAGILDEIVTSSNSVTDGANQVLSASKEQGIGLKQISIAMSQLDKATQENAATAEQTASMSEELGGQTETLNKTVDDMVVLVEGKSLLPRPENHIPEDRENIQKVLHLQPKRDKTIKSTYGGFKKAAGAEYETQGDEDEWEKL